MTAKEYKQLVERNIAKGIVTDTTLSREMPVMMSVREVKKVAKKKVKPKKQQSYSPAEMKQIFNNLIQNV